MIFSPTILYPRVPINKLPESERAHARFIDTLLHDLGRRCVDFDAALKLFDFCVVFLENPRNHVTDREEYWLRWFWRGFATREAIATIYRVSECLEHAGKNLGNCPTLATMIDIELKRAATKAFSANFPGFGGVRHASQHFASLYGTPESFASHAAGDLNFVNHLEGRTVTTIFKKKHVSLEISEDTLLKLREVRDLYWSAYMAAGG